uniref:Uncharacterized protein n=1 Tax=Arundo donax TaxID=35708 RepID=A0A0A8XX01_ARUDO
MQFSSIFLLYFSFT